MNEYVADTHALFWYLINSPKLGANANAALNEGVNGQAIIYIPSIVIAELYCLNNKQPAKLNYAVKYNDLKKGGQYIFTSFEADDVLNFDRDAAVTEIHDRIIVGAARKLNAPLLTKDQNITASGLVNVIW